MFFISTPTTTPTSWDLGDFHDSVITIIARGVRIYGKREREMIDRWKVLLTKFTYKLSRGKSKHSNFCRIRATLLIYSVCTGVAYENQNDRKWLD